MNGAPLSTVLFPGAGSFGSEFRSLTQALEPTAWVVRYPGRYGRDFGVPAESFDAVVAASAEQVTGRGQARPVLFGHSFGAYVAYATALRLQQDGAGASTLVVAGASAPARLEVSAQAVGGPAEAAAYLERVDPVALADAPSQEWREVVAETIVQDLRLLGQFDATSSAKLECPILAVRGQADPLTSDADVGEWAHATVGGFSLRVFPGGHSDFLRTPACASWFREIRQSLD